MKQVFLLLLFFCFTVFGFQANAQHDTHAATAEAKVKDHGAADHHGMKGSHRLTLGLGHTQVSKGKIDGDTKWLSLASWSLNYDYWLSNKWALGVQTDIIVESFIIEDSHGEEIERSYPKTVVPVAIYKPGEHFSFIGGVGAEFAHGHNLMLTRLGIEYGWHLPKNWEVGAALVWDNRWNYYNAWGIAFTVSKIWPKKHH